MHVRRWVTSSVSVFAATVVALIAIGIQPPSMALASSTQSGAIQAASPITPFPWKGHDPSCEVRLPIPHRVRYGRYTTCPPKRVFVLGDSVATTMGIQMSLDQDNWGTVVDIAGVNGCGYVTGYAVKYLGRFVPMNRACTNDAAVWRFEIRNFRPQAIVVEMGWWDSFQHMINGKVSVLAQPGYDSLVEKQIVSLIHSLGTASAAPIYFLSVPWMQPAALPNGQPDPDASTALHNEINGLIQSATRSSHKAHFVDISPYITPGGVFQADVGGGICRDGDGVHFYDGPDFVHYVHTECGKALQRGVLSMIRQDLTKT